MSRKPVITTERFTIYKQEIEREQKFGGFPRSVFLAFPRASDIPRPVCMVTVFECFQNYVEWVWVCELHRRKGIATDVVQAIEQYIGQLTLDGATREGRAFCRAYKARSKGAKA